MDRRSARDKDAELDLESRLPLIGDETKRASPSGNANHGKTMFSKFSDGFVLGGSLRGEFSPSLYFNEPNSSQVSMDLLKVTLSKSMMGQDSTNQAEKTPVAKENRKKSSNKKAPKPPRPPQSPTLDAADHKLIRELSELAMLKRARVERMKALKKMKAAKASSSSSSNSSILAMVFTIVFCIVIIFQGLSSGRSSVASFQGSPLSTGGVEDGLISVQYQLTPSTSESNAPGSESHNFVRPVAGSDLAEKLQRDSG